MSRSQMKYHPTIGFTYMPSAKLRMPAPRGGYLVRTNAAGFRSDREFARARTPGKFRALVFGDSQTAGDGGANAARYTDLLEKAVPGLEIYNYALSGAGPDQHYLAYQACGDVEHDLLVVALYVENIRRVGRSVVQSLDSNGAEAFYPKPYYTLDDGKLVLHNVPVPKQPWTPATLPAELRSQIYSFQETNFFSRDDRPVLRKLAAHVPMKTTLKQWAMRLSRFEPLPDYDDRSNSDWLLLRGIFEAWFRGSKVPVLLVSIPHYAYFLTPSGRPGYQPRLRELASATGCEFHDLLPELAAFPDNVRQSLWSEASGHLSTEGHRVFAQLLAPVFERRVREAVSARAGAESGGGVARPAQAALHARFDELA